MSMKVGVSGLVYAKVLTDTEEGTTYGAIKAIPGTVSIENKTGSSIDNFFADNGAYENTTSLGEITVDLEIADPSPEVIADILGHKIVAGVMDFNVNDVPADVAIGFVGLKANGANRLVWLRKGKFKESDDTYKTKGSKSEPQSQKLSGSFVALKSNGSWKKTADSDAVGVLPATIANWFKVETLDVTIG